MNAILIQNSIVKLKEILDWPSQAQAIIYKHAKYYQYI